MIVPKVFRRFKGRPPSLSKSRWLPNWTHREGRHRSAEVVPLYGVLTSGPASDPDDTGRGPLLAEEPADAENQMSSGAADATPADAGAARSGAPCAGGPTGPGVVVMYMSGRVVMEVNSPEADFLAVWKLKQDIAGVAGVTPSCQQLVVDGEILPNDASLSDFRKGTSTAPLNVWLVVQKQRGSNRCSTPTRMRALPRSQSRSSWSGRCSFDKLFYGQGIDFAQGHWQLNDPAPSVPTWLHRLLIWDETVIYGTGETGHLATTEDGQLSLAGGILSHNGRFLCRQVGMDCQYYTLCHDQIAYARPNSFDFDYDDDRHSFVSSEEDDDIAQLGDLDNLPGRAAHAYHSFASDASSSSSQGSL